MLTVTKSGSVKSPKVVDTVIAQVKGGVSLNVANLIAGAIVIEGTPLTAPTDGKRTICKQAKILSGSTTTAIKVESTFNHFKVGDVIGAKTAGKAYAISSITTANGISTLNVGTAIDAVTEGAHIYEMAAEAASNTSALKNAPDTILESAFVAPVESTTAWLMADACTRADVKEGFIGTEYLALLSQVKVVKY